MASDTEDTEDTEAWRLEMDCVAIPLETSGMPWAKPPSANRVSQGRRGRAWPAATHACRRQWVTYASVDSPYPTTLARPPRREEESSGAIAYRGCYGDFKTTDSRVASYTTQNNIYQTCPKHL